MTQQKMYATKQEFETAGKAEWRQVIINYFCDCIEHVLNLAPLPEYERAVLVLRQYADGRIDRDDVKQAYQAYKKFHKWRQSYTPEGEIGRVILFAFSYSLSKQRYWGNWYMYRCTEAVYLATRDDGTTAAFDAQHEETQWQDAHWREVQTPLDKWIGGWRAHKKQAATAATATRLYEART